MSDEQHNKTHLFHAREDYNGRIVDLEAKIPSDEPVMLFRGQDPYVPSILEMYANAVEENDGDESIITAVRKHAQRMIKWQIEHDIKQPDMPADTIV